MNRIFTSESVTQGHPDKMCDQISDAVLDAILEKDPTAHVACETVTTTGLIMVMGEITTNSWVDIEKIARDTTIEIGYDGSDDMFDGSTCAVLTSIHQQSEDIALGVNRALETRDSDTNAETGAGDQGMMFGYACDETDVLMPMPINLANKITHKLAQVRINNEFNWLRPDGKAQVTVRYENDKPVGINTIVLSTQHSPDVSHKTIEEAMIECVIKKSIPNELIDSNTKYLINPTGRFVIGGPVGDSGLTGRKIIVDTYGGYARHGGGAFSGKDPTKVDRSASYAARYVAKNIVAAGLAKRVEVALAYAIGVANPVNIFVDTFGTGKISDSELSKIITKIFNLTPDGIINNLNLRRPIYKKTASYGHFGRKDILLPWEELNAVEKLKSYI